MLPDCDHGPFSLSKEPRRFQPTAEAALDDIKATAAEVVQRPGVYGHVDIIGGHLSRISQLHPNPTRAVCSALLGAHADRVLIGAWIPML